MNLKQLNGKMILGPLLILLGVYLLLNPTGHLSAGRIIAYMWPTMFVIPLGILFHWMYFSMSKRQAHGLLIPGGILLTAGIVSQIATLFHAWHLMWPGFLLAPAVGLLEFYVFDFRNKWLLVPISVLTVLSLMFFAVFSLGSFFHIVMGGQPFIAIALIAIGILTLWVRPKSQ